MFVIQSKKGFMLKVSDEILQLHFCAFDYCLSILVHPTPFCGTRNCSFSRVFCVLFRSSVTVITVVVVVNVVVLTKNAAFFTTESHELSLQKVSSKANTRRQKSQRERESLIDAAISVVLRRSKF